MRAGLPARALAFCRRHPGTIAIVLLFVVGGVVAGETLPMFESLSHPKRILGGALAGLYFALFPLGFRLFDR